MVLVVKCLICQKELTYTKGNPSPLVAHVKFDHPKIKGCFESDRKETLDKAIEANLEKLSKRNFIFVNKSAQTDLVEESLDEMDQEEFPPLGQIGKSGKKSKKNVQNQPPVNVNQAPIKPPPISYARILRSPEDFPQSSDFTRLDGGYQGATMEDDIEDNIPQFQPPPMSSFESNPPPPPPGTSKDKIFIDTRKGQVNYSKAGHANKIPDKRSAPQSHDVQRTYYMRSLEKWKPVGDMKIHCPRCQAYKRPIIKAPNNQTDSSVFAAFMRACFPLYCSPCCILATPKFEYLYCPICDFHLGIYDHQKQTIFHDP